MRSDDWGLVTVAEAAARVGVEPVTIRVWIHRYGLPVVREGRRTYVAERAVVVCDRDRRHSHRGPARKMRGNGRNT